MQYLEEFHKHVSPICVQPLHKSEQVMHRVGWLCRLNNDDDYNISCIIFMFIYLMVLNYAS